MDFKFSQLMMNLLDNNKLHLESFDADKQETIDNYDTVSFDMTNYVAQIDSQN